VNAIFGMDRSGGTTGSAGAGAVATATDRATPQTTVNARRLARAAKSSQGFMACS